MNVTNAESLLINLVVCLGTSTKKKDIVFSGAHKVLEKIVPKNLKFMATQGRPCFYSSFIPRSLRTQMKQITS